MLLWSVASEDLAIDISSVEVVPFLLVLSLSEEHAEMGTTFVLRITHLNSLETETQHVIDF